MSPKIPRRQPRYRRAAGLALTAILVGATLPAWSGTAATATVVSAHHPTKTASATLTEVKVPGTKPLSAAAVDLAKYGYTEKEYYASGEASRYRGAVAGATSNATLIDSGWPYRTRVLVRTPDARHFNGTLIVEWTNVTIGLDADFVFAEAHDRLLREGYAYAVVSAQRVGVQRLTTWSPQRYGSLSVAASNVDPQGGGNVDACGIAPCPGDPLSWDIFTQVSKALKANTGHKAPLPGLKVKSVIATGQSQSASRLTAYYNTIQPLANVFDGFVFWDRATAKLRSDVRVPGISVNSEGLVPVYAPYGTSKYTREWEVAGSTHGSLIAADYVDAMFVRDHGLIGPDGQPESFSEWVEPSCAVLPAFSTIPNGVVVAAATDAVRTWIKTGKPAAPSIYFQRDSSGNVIRDTQGNIKGGVRLSQFVAPTVANKALNGTAFPCSVSGSHRDYTAQELKARYRTHLSYVAQVTAAAWQTVKAGYVLPADAAAAIKEALRSNVAR